MVRYGAQGESTVQYCGTIVVHGTVRGTARRMRSWYICMVRYGTVQIYYSGTWHMVQYVSHIAPMYGTDSAAISAAILVRYHFSYLKTWYGTVHMVRLVRYTWLDCYGFVRLVQCMVHSVHWLVGCSCWHNVAAADHMLYRPLVFRVCCSKIRNGRYSHFRHLTSL